jgi:transposase
MRTEGSADVLEYRRRLAVERVVDGDPIEGVADFLGVDPRSVRRWVAAFLRGGEEALSWRPVPGRPGKLNGEQELTVISWLLDSPAEHGFSTDRWTAPRVAQLIDQRFGIHFHPRSLNRWLRVRGFTPQKPCCFAQERDPEAVAHWLQYDWPRIQRKVRRQDATLVFLDESGLLMMPLLRRSQAPRGHRPVLKVRLQHRLHVSVAAALWVSARWDAVGMFSQTLLNSYFNNQRMASFLHRLMRRIPGPVVVVWNGGPMHHGQWIRLVQQMYRGRLVFEPLPAYAADLNPVEQLWQFLKDCQLVNFAPTAGEQLLRAVHAELTQIRWDTLRLWCFFHQSALPLPRTLLM